MPTTAGLLEAAHFFARLPFQLRRTLDETQARQIVQRRLAQRADLFLDRIRHDVFARPGSAYERLFRHAGMQPGDVERLVREDGLEGALRRMLREGVYLTVDEYKGRAEMARGSLRLRVNSSWLRSPRAGAHLAGSSSGSRGSGTPLFFDMKFVRDCGASSFMNLAAWGGAAWKKATWESPLIGGRFRQLKYAMFGDPPAANFSQIDTNDPSLGRVFHWNRKAILLASRLAGRALPDAVFVSPADPSPIALWMSSVLRQGGIPFIQTFPGSCVAICLAAMEKGIDIRGARFLIAGEPVTEARVAVIRRAGAVPIARYGSVELGAIGYGCLHAASTDEVHLQSHMHAMIRCEDEGAAIGLPEAALMVTTLHAQSPFLMINLSMGDQAELGNRDCGCPSQRLGLTTHLSEIRSFEKLTGMGVTFLGTDVIRVLEETLPGRFGGAPTHYQLAEDESEDGQPILWLRVHPAVGQVDESAVAEAFLEALAAVSPGSRVMTQRWRDSRTLRVERRAPELTRSGKILYLQSSRKPQLR